MSKTHSFSRSEFYELVWSKASTSLAEELGISDVAIHKICRRHFIPKPPRGWWGKRKANTQPERPALPPLPKDFPQETIVIVDHRSGNQPTETRQNSPKTSLKYRHPRTEADQIIHKTMGLISRSNANENGIITLIAPDVLSISISRIIATRVEYLLWRLLSAAEDAGIYLMCGEKQPAFLVKGMRVHFCISESVKRVDASKAVKNDPDIQKWLRHWKPAQGTFVMPKMEPGRREPSGLLRFEIEPGCTVKGTPQRVFRDTPSRRVDGFPSLLTRGLLEFADDKRRREAYKSIVLGYQDYLVQEVSEELKMMADLFLQYLADMGGDGAVSPETRNCLFRCNRTVRDFFNWAHANLAE